MKKCLCMFLGSFLMIGMIHAQNQQNSGTVTPLKQTSGKVTENKLITGKVTDRISNQPMTGVTISAGGVNTLSDADGNYKISFPNTAKRIQFQFVGYETIELAIPASNTINITMVGLNKALDEVVVTGYSRERKNQFSGAATVLSSKIVETVPVGSFDQALQGRAPGMLVNSGSGQPGTSANITIRGTQSIQGSQGAGAQPLFIMDGVPLPAFDMQSINPNDFESITVLKDASAAALYGARGGTGVIVITTKRGKAGVTNFQYRTQLGVTQRPSFERLNLMNTKEMLAYEEREKIPGSPGWTYSSLNPAIPAGMNAARKQFLLDSLRGIDIDYANIFYRQGISQTHDVSMSGGNDKTRFYISANYFDQEGIDLSSKLTRYSTRFNIDHTSNKLTVQMNSTIGYSISKYSEGEVLGNSARNSFQMTFRAKTYENPYRSDGSLIFGANTNLNLKQVGNLLEGMQNSSRDINQLKINAGLSIGYKILPNLNFKNTFGLDLANDLHTRYIKANSFIGSLQTFQSGLAQEANKVNSQFINTTSLIFNKRIAGVHELEAGAYFEVVRGYQKALGFSLLNLDPRLNETGQGAGALPVSVGQTTYPQSGTSAKSGFGIRSYFSSLRYTYDNRYTLNANIRRDGTSRIVNEDNKQITTWSAGVIWNALQEKFLSNQKIFDDLKVKVSYGIVPNIGSIATNTYTVGLATVTNYLGPQVPTFGTVTYPGSVISGLSSSTPGNANLRIERIHKLNIGVDFAIWNNRAKFGIDVYNNRTVDLFVRQPLSTTTGFANLDINAGIMTNKGVELSASVEALKGRDYGVTISMNHAINKNNIEDLGLLDEYTLGTFLIKKGLPFGTHRTTNYLGADPATGRPMYEGEDGKVTLDPAKAANLAKFGNFMPKHTGGANIELRYKAISISAFFSYQFDVVRYDNVRSWNTRGTPGFQSAVRASRELIDNQWQKPGDVKFYSSSLYDRGFTSADLFDAKFLRFRNLNVSYQVPAIKTANGNVLIKGGRFYIQAQNLAIWSPWKGLDPEDNNNISLNEYPNPKMFVVGLDINF